jgi:hypothetical protein
MSERLGCGAQFFKRKIAAPAKKFSRSLRFDAESRGSGGLRNWCAAPHDGMGWL